MHYEGKIVDILPITSKFEFKCEIFGLLKKEKNAIIQSAEYISHITMAQ